MFWRKPVTHATALWVLVGIAGLALLATLAYANALAKTRSGIVQAYPPRDASARDARQHPPTLFGTVVSFDGTIVRIASKQDYDEIVVESDTAISTVGGSAVPSSEIRPGAVLTATGSDLGDRRLSAVSIVILENR